MDKCIKSNRLIIDVESKVSKISLKELSEDIGAFLYFLRNHSALKEPPLRDGVNDSGICSVWMLIPSQLDVEFREGIKDCLLEKEVYSRKILIISEPVDEEDKINRRRELLSYFSHILDGDQSNQIIGLLQKLDDKSREKISDDFRIYKENLKKVNSKKTSKKPKET